MKNWLSKIFGGQKKAGTPVPASEPPPLGITVTQEKQLPPSSDRSIEMTLAASPPEDPQALRVAEEQVAAEWKVGDVILDLYEVKQVHEGGGMGLVYRVHHRSWNTDLAVKSPRSDYFQTEALHVAHQAGLRGTQTGLLRGWCWRAFEGHRDGVTSVALSADGRWALSGGGDKTLRLWDVSSGKCTRTFEGHTGGVQSVALSADGRWALSGGWDNILRLWEVSSGKCIRTFEGHKKTVWSVALSRDGRCALSGSGPYAGSGENTLRLWDVSNAKCLRTFNGHTDTVLSVALSADGRWALSGSRDKTLRLWEVSSGKCLRTFEGHASYVVSVALGANERWALSGSGDSTLRLWEVSSGKCLRTFEGHTKQVDSVALSGDGRWALSGSRDRTGRLWNVSSGKCLTTLEGHTDSVYSVALSGDGRWALSGSGDDTLRLWELEWERDFPDAADWDEGARSYLNIFLTIHCPLGEDGFTRVGQPAWTEEDFQKLLTDLQHCGYGWLRPEGVRRELEKMTAEWQGPPAMPWEQVS